jgi:hypothetical protein
MAWTQLADMYASTRRRHWIAKVAMEAALVGIMPSKRQFAIGLIFHLAGATFAVTGYATKEEFMDKLREEFPHKQWSELPAEYIYFLRVSTD